MSNLLKLLKIFSSVSCANRTTSFLFCRWRPETHSFHLPCGEMTVTLQDTQKFLGVRISGRPVIGHCNAASWREREWRSSLEESFLQRHRVPTPLEYSLVGWGIILVSVLFMQTNRQLPTTAGHGSCTYLVVFSSPMGLEPESWIYLPCLTDGHTAGAVLGSCTSNFARRVAGVRRTLH
jgi:hypothetical protein